MEGHLELKMAGAGGGYTGIFEGGINANNAILIAGAGGGSGSGRRKDDDDGQGGNGGGQVGGNAKKRSIKRR